MNGRETCWEDKSKVLSKDDKVRSWVEKVVSIGKPKHAPPSILGTCYLLQGR